MPSDYSLVAAGWNPSDACLFQVVLPLLCFDAEDAELWEEDPQEFVRKVNYSTHAMIAVCHELFVHLLQSTLLCALDVMPSSCSPWRSHEYQCTTHNL